ncbi:hypothetical protein BKK44_09955 [Bacillus cereus]|nr:hypothetical protein BKK44_09955 [Bacillus cereus]
MKTLLKEHREWLNERNVLLKSMEVNKHVYSAEDILISFMEFYHNVCSWYNTYHLPSIEIFQIEGSFYQSLSHDSSALLELYRRLLDFISEYNFNKPVEYVAVINKRRVLVEEFANGEIKILKEIS